MHTLLTLKQRFIGSLFQTKYFGGPYDFLIQMVFLESTMVKQKRNSAKGRIFIETAA